MTSALYEIETSEANDGTMIPAEGIWKPAGEEAVDRGFVVYRELYIGGISAPHDDTLYPQAFITLGHHRWTDVIEAAVGPLNAPAATGRSPYVLASGRARPPSDHGPEDREQAAKTRPGSHQRPQHRHARSRG
ncbi:hypothetical protein [Streptomyces sp. bgisy027]|uniref:hypothetical protein n=1 Tax=Streptomyces sp. bgisy027 TaxID=3413770 RepID=UPI003D754FB5